VQQHEASDPLSRNKPLPEVHNVAKLDEKWGLFGIALVMSIFVALLSVG
jgi:hypothetical protein